MCVSPVKIKSFSFLPPIFSKSAITSEEIIFTGPRGDEDEPGPIEADCQKQLQNYIEGVDYLNKGFTKCELKKSKVGWKETFDESECPSGFSPQGCFICTLLCQVDEM